MDREKVVPAGASGTRSLIFLETFKNGDHSIALLNGFIEKEVEDRSPLHAQLGTEHHLDMLGPLRQLLGRGRPLVTVAHKTNEHGGRLEVWGHLDLVHREQTHLLDIQLTAQQFADFPPEKLGHPLDTPARGRREMGRHGRNALFKFGGDLFHGITLNDITLLIVIEAFQANTALHARANFIRFVLKALEGQ